MLEPVGAVDGDRLDGIRLARPPSRGLSARRSRAARRRSDRGTGRSRRRGTRGGGGVSHGNSPGNGSDQGYSASGARRAPPAQAPSVRVSVFSCRCQRSTRRVPPLECTQCRRSAPVSPDASRSAWSFERARGAAYPERVRRLPLDSTAIASAGYDAGTAVLELEFTSGEVYRYFAVPPSVHRELRPPTAPAATSASGSGTSTPRSTSADRESRKPPVNRGFQVVRDTGIEPVTSSVSGKRATAAPIAPKEAVQLSARWRRDSNPCKRLCRPVPSRSATPPRVV